MICGLPMLVLMSVSFDRRSVLCETFSWPGLEAGESRLVFRSYFLGACLRSGDGRRRSSFEGFSSLSLRPASPVGFSSVSTGGLFVAFIRPAVLRAGFFAVCSTWNVWALILWFVVCQGRLAGPDGPAAFFV